MPPQVKFDSPYDPKKTEGEIYRQWEESGYFNPDYLPGERKDTFSMVLPPPNVTGTLHVGHALTVTIEDILTRFERMRGKKTLWLPGTDHASIATETKFLKEKKISRGDYANRRNEFVQFVNEFALQNQDVIIRQLRVMGASLDWSRLAYTLDEKRQRAVRAAFEYMYRAGLIYHGEYLVNWDPKGQTTISDDEVEYEPAKGTLWTFRYAKDFPIPIATTRPETKLGDVAVAVHPQSKWKTYIGKTYNIENFCGVTLRITIVGDESVDPRFGTGAVGITPAHSKIDWDIAKRQNLPLKQVIGEYGKIINTKTDLDGTPIAQAREKIVAWLRAEQLLEKEEVIEHNNAKAQRSGGLIEILPKRHQFFVNVAKPIPEREGKTLKDLMHEAVASGKIKIIPERFEKIYFHWIENLRDWNISRQVWFGHPIPAWYRGEEIVVAPEQPGKEWEPVNDTFDTWFSSGLWTFSTLGWPEETKDLKTYHPTDVLETGYDILFFWVARMILMSTFFLKEVPFRTVYLHGLVRDEKRRKMSKSLGNVIDPLVMTEKYGTDAFRMALIFNTAPGTDSSISEEKIKGMKRFANKIWNITRYVLKTLPANEQYHAPSPKPEARTEADKDILIKLETAIKNVTYNLEMFQIHEAAQDIYQFIWHEFADKYVETSKKQLADANLAAPTRLILMHCLLVSLKLLHPFMPFVTEEIWKSTPLKEKKFLMIEQWPSQ